MVFFMNEMQLQLPDGLYIYPGDVIRIGRFKHREWAVAFGWYSWGGNRSTCGWYLTSDDLTKPIYQTDLDDVYIVTTGGESV